HTIEELPARVVSDLAEKGGNLARENLGPRGTPPTSLLDQTVLTVHDADREVTIPMRCLFAMSGMGFLGGDADSGTGRVRVTDSWLRLDARYGAVVRRRRALLPLLTSPAACRALPRAAEVRAGACSLPAPARQGS